MELLPSHFNKLTLQFESRQKEESFILRSLERDTLIRQLWFMLSVVILLLFEALQLYKQHHSVQLPTNCIFLGLLSWFIVLDMIFISLIAYISLLIVYIWRVFPIVNSLETTQANANFFSLSTSYLLKKWGRPKLLILYYINLGAQLLQICLWAISFPYGAIVYRTFALEGLIRSTIVIVGFYIMTSLKWVHLLIIAWLIPLRYNCRIVPINRSNQLFTLWDYCKCRPLDCGSTRVHSILDIVGIYASFIYSRAGDKESYFSGVASTRGKGDTTKRIRSTAQLTAKYTTERYMFAIDFVRFLLYHHNSTRNSEQTSEDLFIDASIMFVELKGFDGISP